MCLRYKDVTLERPARFMEENTPKYYPLLFDYEDRRL
jgi:hypothetical protein